MPGMTVNAAARETGWSPRMLRYLEGLGLVAPARTPSGYRHYQARDVMRLRALRDLRARHALDLAGLAFAARLRREPKLRAEVEAWLASGEPSRPEAWLDFEQRKAQGLLAA
jgi:MerR family transcriptional regulator, copper efflux regulator